NRPIHVTSLGVFDSGSDGLKRPITAILFDRDTKAVVKQLVFQPGEGTLIGGSRYKTLDTPIDLPAGFHGMMVAEGYGPEEPNGNRNSPGKPGPGRPTRAVVPCRSPARAGTATPTSSRRTRTITATPTPPAPSCSRATRRSSTATTSRSPAMATAT